MRRFPLLVVLFLAATMGLLPSGGSAAAHSYFMGQAVYGYSGY